MSTPSLNYSEYYVPQAQQQQSSYSSQSITLHHPHEHHQMAHQMQAPPSPPIPLDPSLALYAPQYYGYQQPHMPPPHLTIPTNVSSPSSQASETVGTPPNDQFGFPVANANGKRPSSSTGQSTESRKKARQDDDTDRRSPTADKGDEAKAKPTRGSRACTVCRRLKMKCVGAENGPPCKRCQTGNHECIFEESNRGKRSTKKHEILTRSLRKMERTLDTVLRSLGNPSIAAGMLSRSPSPTPQGQATQALLASPTPPQSPSLAHQSQGPPGSPKLPSLPDNSLNPLGLLAEASLANRRAQAASQSNQSAILDKSADTRKVGVASEMYFKPGPMTILPLRRLFIERQIQPEMLSFVSTEEVVALFKIYFEKMNIHCALLDPDFHTPSLVCSRSPFLLTTICAVASRFYAPRPELQTKLAEISRKLAFSVPAAGYKSVEIVQAYLLSTLWGCGPVERYEQDRTWFLLGMAIRMATDLNLHRRTTASSQSTAEGRARDLEVHNRERTWIVCFCLDRSFSAQMGKPYTIKEDFVIRNASVWSQSPVAMTSDGSLAAYADLQRILTRSLDLLYSGTSTSSGLQQDCDYLLVIKTMETQLLAWQHEWTHFKPVGGSLNDYAKKYTELAGKFYFHYAMLTVNSFGLQNALERSAVDIGHFFARCHSSAVNCATLLRDELGPLGYLQYAPDSRFVQGSYAVLSLLKLLRPEFQSFLDHEQKTLAIVNDVANIFDTVAVGNMHTPALYACFLRALIAAKTEHPQSATSMTQSEANSVSSTGTEPPVSQPGSAQPNGHAFTADPFAGFTAGEMGPVADISTFPPTMAPNPPAMDMSMMAMDDILSSDFWDSVLVPGSSNTMESLSAGFVYGAGGSGLITPRMFMSPLPSGVATPARGGEKPQGFTQEKLDNAFDVSQSQAQVNVGA